MKSKYAKKRLKATIPVTIPFKTTWSHPLVAIEFSEWISPEFYAWCRTNIQTLSPKAKKEKEDNLAELAEQEELYAKWKSGQEVDMDPPFIKLLIENSVW